MQLSLAQPSVPPNAGAGAAEVSASGARLLSAQQLELASGSYVIASKTNHRPGHARVGACLTRF